MSTFVYLIILSAFVFLQSPRHLSGQMTLMTSNDTLDAIGSRSGDNSMTIYCTERPLIYWVSVTGIHVSASVSRAVQLQ